MPHELTIAAMLAACLAAGVISGYSFVRVLSLQAARALFWLQLLVGTFGIERLTRDEPSGFRMIALIAFAMIAIKAIVYVEDLARGAPLLKFGQWLAFALGWPGMQPRLFSSPRLGPLQGAGRLVARGAVRFMLGAVLVATARFCGSRLHSRVLPTLLLLPGLSLMLHFGLCNILAGGWRRVGVNCEALFRAPLRSQNLAEFWSRRWNLAFSEMTAIAVYRPLSKRVGRGTALFAAFLFSGL